MSESVHLAWTNVQIDIRIENWSVCLFKDWILRLKLWSEDFGEIPMEYRLKLKWRWNFPKIIINWKIKFRRKLPKIIINWNCWCGFFKEYFSLRSLWYYCINVRWQKQMLCLWASFSTSLLTTHCYDYPILFKIIFYYYLKCF